MNIRFNTLAALVLVNAAPPVLAQSQVGGGMGMMSPGLMIPAMDPVKGGELFVSKGCVVCHSINGIGGEDAPPLDAEYMDLPMSPFDFAARMWRGAPMMIEAQEDELGSQIEFTGEELGDIIAFVHDAELQASFSEDDVPEEMLHMMAHTEEGGHDEDAEGHPAED